MCIRDRVGGGQSWRSTSISSHCAMALEFKQPIWRMCSATARIAARASGAQLDGVLPQSSMVQMAAPTDCTSPPAGAELLIWRSLGIGWELAASSASMRSRSSRMQEQALFPDVHRSMRAQCSGVALCGALIPSTPSPWCPGCSARSASNHARAWPTSCERSSGRSSCRAIA